MLQLFMREHSMLSKGGIKKKGGIDLNPNILDLQSLGERMELDFSLDPQQIEAINIDGLFPFIINIAPVTSLNLLLGAK